MHAFDPSALQRQADLYELTVSLGYIVSPEQPGLNKEILYLLLKHSGVCLFSN